MRPSVCSILTSVGDFSLVVYDGYSFLILQTMRISETIGRSIGLGLFSLKFHWNEYGKEKDDNTYNYCA